MTQKGNVLFLILIAVALFAALSYTVTSSYRTNDSGLTKDNSKIALSRMNSFASKVRFGVSRIILSGTKLEELDFRSNSRIALNGNAQNWYKTTACTDTKCQVFYPDGGGIAYESFEDFAQLDPPPSSWNATWTKPGHPVFFLAKVGGAGSDLPDIIMRINGIQNDVCEYMLYDMGISNPNSPTGTAYSYTGVTPDTGLYATDAEDYESTNPALYAKTAWCREAVGLGYSDFNFVIYER